MKQKSSKPTNQCDHTDQRKLSSPGRRRSSSVGFQSLGVVRRCPLLVAFGTSAVPRRRHLGALSSLVPQLAPFSSLLHLTDLLGEERFERGNEPRDDLKVSEADLKKENPTDDVSR